MKQNIFITVFLTVLILCGCGKADEQITDTAIVRADTTEDEVKPEIPSDALEIERENLLALEQSAATPAPTPEEEKAAPVKDTFKLKISKANITPELEKALEKTLAISVETDDASYIYTLDLQGKETLKKTMTDELKAYVQSVADVEIAVGGIDSNDDFSRFVLTVTSTDWSEELESKTVEELTGVWRIYKENFSESEMTEIVILDMSDNLIADVQIKGE